MNENRTSSSRTHRDGREPSGFCCMKQKTQSLPHCRGVIGSKSMPQDSLSSFSTSTRHSSPPALTTSIVSSSSPDVRNLKSSASRTRRPLIVHTRSPISSSSSAASESGSTPIIFIPFAIRLTSHQAETICGLMCDLRRAYERIRHRGLRFHQLPLHSIAGTFQPVFRPFPAQPERCVHPKLQAHTAREVVLGDQSPAPT